ncbi:MAG TPA: hypothetical protein VFZ61_19630 [Polyangiales bacterium]
MSLLLLACESGAGAPGNADGPKATAQHAAPAVHTPAPPTSLAATFDALVTADLLFSSSAQRALYRAVPPETLEDRRVYGFELEPQPGMEPNRHFHVVSVSIGPAKGTLDAEPVTLAGPNGAFTELAIRTADGLYDVSVSEGSLLPDAVKSSPFDLSRAARSVADRYRARDR